ncbi:ribonuclease HI [Bifidobacterium sp. ESL0784]|nr:ribonuclease H [Bifidobacterium sp. ESL0784]MDF7640481.1 ribonuclease HI [Bifidobacterium sp. ESL0784]
MTITVSTDGSALGNPNGPMGWAWADHASNAARTDGHQHDGDSDAGGATNGTNQIGELCAVLEALRAHRGAEPLTIETDSQYAINCSTTWVKGWKKNGWKNSQKKPVKNAPLIKAIDVEINRREGPVKFVWVKGHNGNPGNEKVDDLAHTYSGDARSGVKDGYLPLEGWQSLLASPYAKGVDIPADARMLLDGKITEEQYHLGRGAESGDDDSDNRDDSEDTGNTTPNRNEPNGKQIAGDERAAKQTSHKPTLAERLAEPEGVPEYDFNERKPIVAHHRAAENDEPSDGNDRHDQDNHRAGESSTIGRTVRSHPDFGASPVGDDITIPEDRSDGTAKQPEPPAVNSTPVSEQPTADTIAENNETDGMSAASDNGRKNDSTDGDADNKAANGVSDDCANTQESGQANNDATTAIAPKPPETSGKPGPKQAVQAETNPAPSYLPSGLSLSGPLRFFPAPQTSPTYNGRPRHIRGVVVIDGDVAGDGTIVLSNAPFLIANNSGKK